MMLVMRPCAQRNIACRRHCAHFGHPRPYLSPATPLHSPPNVPPRSWTSTTPTHPCFVLLAHCPRAACTDACGATMCSTQPCLPRAVCTFWTPKTIPQPRNTAPFTSPRASREAWSTHAPRSPPSSLPSTTHAPPVSLPTPPTCLRSRSPPSSLPPQSRTSRRRSAESSFANSALKRSSWVAERILVLAKPSATGY